MNVMDVLKYGDLEVERTVESFDPARWEEPGVTGAWSGKDVLAHLASFEQVLVDIVRSLGGESETPYLDAFRAADFNETQVAMRRGRTLEELLAEYRDAYGRAMALLAELDPELLRRPGTMPWYGAEYAFDDLVAYQYYGHKREHCAQFAAFMDSRTVPARPVEGHANA